jgi:hypothetical protein
MRSLRIIVGIMGLMGMMAARAATGDITSVTIDTNGWNCFVVFSGMGTNAPTFNNGMGGIIVDGQCLVTNLVDPLTAKFRLWVSSPGFDATGTSNWTTRAVFGTKIICKVYPDNALPDTSSSGGNATVNIALTEHICTNDVVSWDVAASTYVQNSVGNNASTGSCVNNTLLGYPKTFLSLLDYPWNGETNATAVYRAFAYQQAAHDGKPVSCMRCTVSNVLSESWTSNITVMEYDRGRNGTEILGQGQYVARVPLSGFTQGSKLIVQWKAFPWIGNAQSLANTGDGTHIMPSGNAAPVTNVCDKAGTYSKVCFVVDPAGNDSNGRCRIDGDPTAITSDKYFLTPEGALSASVASNNTYFGLNNTSGVNGYLRTGTYAYCMSGKAYGARPDVLPTLQPYPGDSGVIISNGAVNSSSQPTMIRFKGLTFNVTAGSWLSTSNNNWAVWVFDSCTLSNINSTQISATSSSQSYSLAYFVDCAVPQWGQGFVCKGGGAKDTYPLLRGCNLNGFTNVIMAGTRVGNYVTQTNAGPNFYQLTSDLAGQGAEIIDPQVDYNNFWGCMQLGSSVVQLAKNFNVTNGMFIGNDVFEYVTNISPSGRFDFGTANGLNYTNFCFVEDVIVGAPAQFRYNDDTALPSWGIEYQIANCFIDNFDIKGYAFTGGSTGASSGRVGNRSQDYGVAFECVVMNETANLQSSGSFLPDFGGVNLIGVNVDNGSTGGGRTDLMGARVSFVNRKAYDGTVYTGNGDYRWGNGSLVHRLKRRRVLLPYDMWGNQRGDMSPIGFSEADLNK